MRTVRVLPGIILSLLIVTGCSTQKRDLVRAAQLQSSGKTEEALERYVRAAARLTREGDTRTLSRVYVSIGECEWKLDRPAEAFRAFSKGAELDPANSAAHLQLAKLFVSGGAPERAMIAAEIVLSQDPGNLDAMTTAGNAAADEGRRREAVDLLTRVLQRAPNRVDAAVLLSSVYSDMGRSEDARTTLRAAIHKAPNDPTALLALGRLEEEQGRVDAAEAAYRQAVSTRDDAQTELRLAQFLTRSARGPEAEPLLERVDTLQPSEPWSLADFQLRSGNAAQAAERYLRVLSDGRSSAANRPQTLARAVEAQIAVALNGADPQREEALGVARTLLAANHPELDKTQAHILKAEVELAGGNVDAALTAAQSAVDSDSDSAPAHYVLGLVMQKANKPLLARQEWEKALDQDEDFIPVRIALGNDALAAGDAHGAERMVAPVVRHEPENLAALHLFCRALAAQKQYGSAHAVATRALALQKKSPEAYVLLGDVAMASGEPGSALMYYEQALLVSSDYTPAIDGLVRAYRKGNISDAALLRIEKIGLRPPAAATLLELAGRLFAQRGRTEAARRCFSESLAADGNRTSAARELAAISARSGDRGQALALAARTSRRNKSLVSAVAAQDSGDWKTATTHYEDAIQRGDRTGVAANNLAWLYAESGTNLDRALRLAIQARDAQPDNPAVQDTLGYVLLKRREYSRAVGVLKHAGELLRFQKQPDTALEATIRSHLADAYRNSGESGKAQMVSRDPNAFAALAEE